MGISFLIYADFLKKASRTWNSELAMYSFVTEYSFFNVTGRCLNTFDVVRFNVGYRLQSADADVDYKWPARN
jgi:hypothetical protein